MSASYLRGVLRAFAEGRTDVGPKLRDRERQMLRLIAEGKTGKRAAGAMAISVRTAECHRGSLMSKLDIHDTAGLVRYAIRQGMVVA